MGAPSISLDSGMMMIIPPVSLYNFSLLQKHPGLRTVVNKNSAVSAEFRTPDLEVVAGEDELVTQTVGNTLGE